MVAANRDPDRRKGRDRMGKLIDELGSGVTKTLAEIATLGRTLKKRSADVLAFFDRPGTSNGRTAATTVGSSICAGQRSGFGT